MASPYIRINEKDESTYDTTSSSTVVALVGFATKGPIDTPTFCTSIKQFKDIFGLTPKDQPYSHLAAYLYFNQGNSLWFTRIADENADFSAARVLSNDGTGVAAKLISTNNITSAALASGTDYGVKITVEAEGVEYQDTLIINIGVGTDMNELIADLTTAIANSTQLSGKLTALRTKSDGNVSDTEGDNVYLTFSTVETGMDDALTLEDPDSGNSLLSNGSVGFSYSQSTAYGTYSEPSKAILIGNVDLTNVVDLTTNYNLNILVDDDLTTNTIDLAAKNKASAITDTAYSVSTSDGFNPDKYNISVDIDGAGASDIDLTGNQGADATKGYQEISNTGSVGSFPSTTVAGIATQTDYELDVTVTTAGTPTTYQLADISISITDDWDTIAAAIETSLQTASTGTETCEISNGKIKITADSYGGSNIGIAAGTAGTGSGDLLAVIDALGGGTDYTTSIGTAVAGLDVALSEALVLSAINTAITGSAVAEFSTDYLKITTDTEGRTGSITIDDGSTKSAFEFFGTTTASEDGGKETTINEIVSAINSQMNTARSTSGIVYAIAYLKPADGKYYLKLQSEVTGATDAKIYVNSSDGSTEDAPASDAGATVFNSGAWAVSTHVDLGDNGTVNSMFKFVFEEEGTAADLSGTKGCQITFNTRENPLYLGVGDTTNTKYYRDIIVYFDSVEVERFEDVSYNRTDTNWFMTVLNATSENGGSEYVGVEWYQADRDGTLDEDLVWTSTPTTGTYLIPDGTINMSGGNDGIPSGSVDSLYQAGITTFANPEIYDPHILATPGISSSSVINAAKNFIEGVNRKDILFLVDPPLGLEPSEIADWHNGKSELTGAPGTAINSSFLTLYWGWLKTYDEDNGEYVWAPPSTFMVAKLTEIDNNYEPWAIPAGETRGKLTADDYEYSPSQSERDLLYNINGNLNVNPIINVSGTGLIIWGQKTLLRENSALNRVNTRRMVIYAKKLMRNALKKYMFEANTPATWARITTSITNIFEPIRQGGGINSYSVTFDETTTTPSLQDQHICKGVVKVVPVASIEAIEVDFAITNQGVTLG
jgi:hypothetical protein